MEIGKKKMDTLTEDLWTIILVRLPLKSITISKLVCKQWKSIAESPFLRELFLSRHQNSHSSWSLMWRDSPYGDSPEEVVAHYGCNIWGLERSLGSYVSSFITLKFETRKENQRRWLPKEKVRVVSYTDVGLVLISLESIFGYPTFYVANPISRQCVEIPSLPQLPTVESFRPSGLATRLKNGAVLGYKVVLMDTSEETEAGVLRLLIYSSETGLWSFITLQTSLQLDNVVWSDPVCLNGNLYWLSNLEDKEVVVSHDFYVTGRTDRCKVLLFPDVEKSPNFKRVCTTSQGFLMHMNIFYQDNDDVNLEHKLSVWRLKSEEWQLVSEIYPSCIKSGFDYNPLTINPFDAKKMYLWSKMHKYLASTNLSKGKFGLHNNLERSSDGRTLSFSGEWDSMKAGLYDSYFSIFVLPRWLYSIPSPP